MIRSALIATTMSVIAFVIYNPRTKCNSYYPELYNTHDTLFFSSFILVNEAGCKEDLAGMVEFIIEDKPAMILTTADRLETAFQFNEVLKVSLLSCDGELTKFKTHLFKTRLATLDFDTTQIPNELYIDYLNGEYQNLIVSSCDDYKDYNYRNAIVIFGRMTSDVMFNTPEMEPTPQIFPSQLLALLINSMIRKDFITDLPKDISTALFTLICLLLHLSVYNLLRVRIAFWIKYSIIKIAQILISVLLFLFLYIIVPEWGYVGDFNGLLVVTVVLGEILLWVDYIILRMDPDNFSMQKKTMIKDI